MEVKLRVKKRGIIFYGTIILAAVLLWFLGVDSSWFVEKCDDCFYQRDVIQYRIFAIPVYEISEERHSTIELVARDLGKPCPHKNLYRFHKQRWWGLCICSSYHSGITGLVNDQKQYNQRFSAKIKEAAKEDPNLAEVFLNRVIFEHDWEYWEELQNRIGIENIK